MQDLVDLWNNMSPWEQGVLSGMGAYLILLSLTEAYYKWGPRRVKGMDPKRERFINRCLADVVTDGMETLIDEEILSREEVDQIVYKRIGNLIRVYDLIPRNEMTVAQRIRSRMFREWKKISKQEVPHRPRDFKR